jgi:hypothetical protein
LSPGDVFPADWDSDCDDPAGPIIVFSHGCDIDKPACTTLLVATLESDVSTDGWLLEKIKSHQVWHAIHLPGCAFPSWINLRTLRQLEKARLSARIDKRIQSMSDDGCLYLAQRTFEFLTREKSKET